jgi:hypothetical protein
MTIGFSLFIIGFVYLIADYFIEIFLKPIDKFYFYSNKAYGGKYIRVIFSKRNYQKLFLDNEDLMMKSDNVYLSEE